MDEKPLFLLFSFLLIISITVFQTVLAEPVFSLNFGSSGSDDDEFDVPTGIALSPNGQTVLVADTNNNRINAFTDDGDHQYEFGSFCNMETNQGCNDNAPDAVEDGDGQFNEPIDVAVDLTGDIYVVDSQNDRVQRFASDRDFELKFGSSNSNDQDYLGTPNGIAIQESTKDVYVSTIVTDSISVFDSSGTFLFNFGSTGSGAGNFRNPSSMVIDDSKILYISDTDNDRIQFFELVDTSDNCPQGTVKITDGVCFVEEFGSSGSGDGDFNSPSGLALDASNDLLYVADTNNDRIQTFKLVDTSDNCPQGTVKITDGVCFVEEFGSSGSGNGDFNSPSGLALDASNDLLYVADTNNDRIQVFTISGTIQDVPGKPTSISALAASETSIFLTWSAPPDDNIPEITGYKIEYKTGAGSFSTLVADTKSSSTSFLHVGLESNETYTYRVYAINSVGTSNSSSKASAEPGQTTVPTGLVATAISPNQIRLSWIAPSETYGFQISSYEIQRKVTTGVYEEIASVNASPTTYTVSSLQTDKEYTYVVNARYTLGSSDISNEATATPREDSTDETPSPPVTTPTAPQQLKAIAESNQITLSWNAPSSDGNSLISGHKIEVKTDSGYSVLVDNTNKPVRSYADKNVLAGTTYTYRIFAINSVGISVASNEASATAKEVSLEILSLPKLTTDEEKLVQFTVKVTGISLEGLQFSLANNAPSGAQINANTGIFSWTPTKSQGTNSYQFDIIAKSGNLEDKQSVTITVNDVPEPIPEPTPEPKETGIASFVDPNKDPQYYIDRYTNELTYKDWFDSNYPDRTIYEAVGLENPEPEKTLASFVDPNQDPQSYVDRYNNEEAYMNWFDKNYPEYSSIYEAVGLDEPEVEEPVEGWCGVGTKLIDGVCTVVKSSQGGGCLIATAAYGSELAPQVQMLREIRDNSLLQTQSGQSFMQGFNQFYYSFSPIIADYERQNPVFKEAVKLIITPLLASLSLMNYVDLDSEESVLGYGIGIILMNIGMYFVAPAIVIFRIKNR